jgi:hypothetical protein
MDLPNTEGMKLLTDRATAVARLLAGSSGRLPFHGVFLTILVSAPRSDAVTKARRETQPMNRVRQMVEVTGRAIPILVPWGGKRHNHSQVIILAWIARPASPLVADEEQ